MPLASAGNIQLSYDRAGDGPPLPLLLIMGMSGTKRHWGERVLSELRRDFEVIVYDHRDVGGSTRTGAPFTIADLADDAAGLLAALQLDAAHVMGISMGGMVAQELALGYPERVRALTLGCTYCGGRRGPLTGEGVFQRLYESMSSGDRRRAIRTMWEVNVSAGFAADEREWERFLATGMEHGVAIPVIVEQMTAIAGHDTRARLPGLQTPTLVIHGTVDQMIEVSYGRAVAELTTGSRLEILEGVGHMFFLEQPERTAELVREHAAAYV